MKLLITVGVRGISYYVEYVTWRVHPCTLNGNLILLGRLIHLIHSVTNHLAYLI